MINGLLRQLRTTEDNILNLTDSLVRKRATLIATSTSQISDITHIDGSISNLYLYFTNYVHYLINKLTYDTNSIIRQYASAVNKMRYWVTVSNELHNYVLNNRNYLEEFSQINFEIDAFHLPNPAITYGPFTTKAAFAPATDLDRIKQELLSVIAETKNSIPETNTELSLLRNNVSALHNEVSLLRTEPSTRYNLQTQLDQSNKAYFQDMLSNNQQRVESSTKEIIERVNHDVTDQLNALKAKLDLLSSNMSEQNYINMNSISNKFSELYNSLQTQMNNLVVRKPQESRFIFGTDKENLPSGPKRKRYYENEDSTWA